MELHHPAKNGAGKVVTVISGRLLSQKCRKKVEECFGWLKTIAGLDRSRTVGRWKLKQALEMGAAAFNLVRLRQLKPAM